MMERNALLRLIDQATDEGWKELDLAGLGLTELPEEIGKLGQLESLILGKRDEEDGEWIGNELTELPEAIAQLTNLTYLNLSSNKLTKLPAAIAELTNLPKLDLSYNELAEISATIAQLTNLTELYLSYNPLIEIPEAIAQLSKLTALYLAYNGYNSTKNPEAIAQIFSLTTLSLYGNELTELPDSIGQLTNLTWLNLSFNELSKVPNSIGQLTNLSELSLYSNELTELPDSIGQLTNLTWLNLSFNQLTEIPDEIAQLTNLTQLFLSNNQLTEIPDEIARLTNLTQLFLSNNQLTEIPDEIAQISSLDSLSLSNNQLIDIPDEIAQSTNLTHLSLSCNQLTEIPDAIAQLTNLRHLDLGSNQLTEIPDAIAQLTNLTELYLSGNQLTEIPEAIAQLANLTKLDLELNQLTEIPAWLEDLSYLEILDLRYNPLPISPELLDSCEPENLLNYCRQLRSGKVRPLNEAKLLLVGQGSVGKTSLINRLLHRTYNPNESQTDGLNVQPWIVNANSKNVRLNVWDFGGQEIYHATHQFFLTKRSLYLLVCNCRTSEDENRLEYWLKLINSFGDQSPVIIVGNKNDEQPLDINRKALRKKYPNITAILETSCQTDNGIDKLREEIITQVAQLKEVYDLLPLSWFEVKEQLEAMDEDFISYSKYECICESKNIPEEHNQEQLIDLLHRLGLVLSFRNHPYLQNTNVLNPDWVTQGIYTLLSDDRLKASQGILTPDDLSRILPGDRYPTNRHNVLTELIEKFELCFKVDRPSTFLIPHSCPKTNLTTPP